MKTIGRVWHVHRRTNMDEIKKVVSVGELRKDFSCKVHQGKIVEEGRNAKSRYTDRIDNFKETAADCPRDVHAVRQIGVVNGGLRKC